MADLLLPTGLALACPVAAFLLLALAAPLRRAGRPAAYTSIALALVALASAAHAWWYFPVDGEPARVLIPWLPSIDGPVAAIGIQADADSLAMLVLVSLVAFLVQAYSLGYLHDEPPRALGRYYAYQSLFAFSMMGLVLAPNLLQLFICWELVGLCSYLLIGFWYRKPEAARAAVKAFWITKAGDTAMLVGIVMLWGLAGTFDLIELQQLARSGAFAGAGLSVVTFCLYLGAAGKSAQVPLHIWLPDAMEGPTPVSALIHAATMVTAGVYLLFRTSWLFALTPEVLLAVAWIGAVTALMAAILACVQTDIKRVLAYSTVSQLGYMMAAIGAGFAFAGFFHLLTHGVFKALLFLAAGAVIHAVGSNEITHMGGLARRMPQTAVVFLIGTLSLAGIPGFAGFLSKEEILGAVWASGLAVPFAMLLVAAFLTAFYMFRVVFVAFFGTAQVSRATKAPSHDTPGHHDAHGASHGAPHGAPHDPPFGMGGPLWILAALSLFIGVCTLLSPPGGGDGGGGHGQAWLAPMAIGAALGGIGLAWLTYQRRAVEAATLGRAFAPIRRAALERFWIDDLFAGVYRHLLLAGARGIGWVDRYLVDGFLNIVSAWTVSAGDELRRGQTGRVQDYVFGVAIGVLALLVWIGWTL
jgi:NADH-quinone oxidoreductase subunit L